MIRETIVTTQSLEGHAHIAPIGLIVEDEGFVIAPFRPSKTLENLRANPPAAATHTDEVLAFPGALTARRDWPIRAADRIPGAALTGALAHAELKVERITEHPERPRFHCRAVHEANHAPFRGFNRAQAAVVEAAILVSRLNMLPMEKIDREVAYLTIAIEKTAGPAERQAWDWLMAHIAAFKREVGAKD